MNKKIVVSSIIGITLLGFFAFYTFSYQKTAAQPSTPTQALEKFLSDNNADSDIAEAYRFALENPQNVLSTVKCYCGCLKQGHNNNRDCFILSEAKKSSLINEEGEFDLMGLNCGLCIKTALISKQMLAEGKSVQQISDYIDMKFGKI